MHAIRRQRASHDHFVNDGAERLNAAMPPEIEAAVRAEFAEQFASASFLERLKLRIAIGREIRRRLDKTAASPAALY